MASRIPRRRSHEPCQEASETSAYSTRRSRTASGAAKLGIALDGVEVAVEGDLDLHGFFGLDETTRAGFTGIRLDVTPRGPESPERYRELADAVDAHCPVLDLFTHATPVERRLAVAA